MPKRSGVVVVVVVVVLGRVVSVVRGEVEVEVRVGGGWDILLMGLGIEC